MTTWVVDTSPLIFLSKLGRLDLLRKNADVVFVPQAVLDEIQVKPDDATYAIEDAARSWLSVQVVSNQSAVEILLADLDRGEAEAIVLARETGADRLVMDDLDARRFARRVGLEVIGTLGLLLAARLRGEIPSVREEIERLQEYGFRVSSSLEEAVLREAGE